MTFVTAANAQDATAPAAQQTEANVPPVDTGALGLHGETVEIQEHEAAFPPMNPEFFASQILWLAITFGIFFLVLNRVIVPRIGGTLENRRDRIALDLEAAEHMRSEADAAQAAYEQELAEARERSHKTVHETREAIRAESDRERTRLEGELNARLDAAQARIAEIKNRALADVDTIAEDAASTILRTVAGIEASPQEVSSAVRAQRA